MKKVRSICLIVLGAIFLLLGVLGIFLPLLPTTPFILLSAFFWARSSEKFHTWLLENKRFGPMIHNWETNRVIPVKMKWLSTIMMNGAIMSTAFTMSNDRWWLKLIMVAVAISTTIWIWSFPHEAESENDAIAK